MNKAQIANPDAEALDREEPTTVFPPGPAWAVGADREHRGPSPFGPGNDRPGFGQEIDPEDAAGVTGGFVANEREVDPSKEEGEAQPAS
ncbi:MAG: hypothetical protein ACO1SX_09110 [Actinomycetota bacterium]